MLLAYLPVFLQYHFRFWNTDREGEQRLLVDDVSPVKVCLEQRRMDLGAGAKGVKGRLVGGPELGQAIRAANIDVEDDNVLRNCESASRIRLCCT